MQEPKEQVLPDSLSGVSWRNALAGLLCLLGLLQIAGYLFHLPRLERFGRATGASPLPVVFCSMGGFEPYAADFRLEFENRSGARATVDGRSHLWPRLPGTVRRQIYRTALSYTPILPKQIWAPIVCYGIRGPLQQAFSLPADITKIHFQIQTNIKNQLKQWTIDLICEK
jgi:hypothetical protein